MPFERNYDKDELIVKLDGFDYEYRYAGNCVDCGERLFTCMGENGNADEKIHERVALPVGDDVLLCPPCYPEFVLEVETMVKGEVAYYFKVGECKECGIPVYRCTSHPIRNDEAVGRRLAAFSSDKSVFCQAHDVLGARQRAKGVSRLGPADEWVGGAARTSGGWNEPTW